MFERKIEDIVRTTAINNDVYNGTRKITEPNKNFMSTLNIRNAIQSLKLKNLEGYDRIPQRILIDGMSIFHSLILHDLLNQRNTLLCQQDRTRAWSRGLAWLPNKNQHT